MSTLTAWRRPVRRHHSWPAASAAAAMVACAAVPMANEEGSTGSAPLNSSSSRAASEWPAARHSAATTSCGLGAVISSGAHAVLNVGDLRLTLGEGTVQSYYLLPVF